MFVIRGHSHAFVQTLVLGLLALMSTSCLTKDMDAERKLFLQAEAHLEKNQLHAFKKSRQQLESYPLVVYLDYQELTRRLMDFPQADVDAFLDQHKGTQIAQRLGRDWLRALAQDERWSDYRRYYTRIQPGSAELRCYFLHARLLDGDDSALDEVAPLWNVGHSQANACDPVFDVWMAEGYPDNELAWDRHKKAIAAGNLSLARYIRRAMSPSYQRLAELYLKVHRKPEHLASVGQVDADNPKSHEIILHGIKRYAVSKPLAASELWERFDASHFFDADARADVQEHLIIHLVVEGQMAVAEKLLQQREVITNIELIAWLVRDALRNEDWERVYSSILLFDSAEQERERWLYWRARALAALGQEDPLYGEARQLYARLALSRSFYGFLAADVLGQDYSLFHRPVDPSADLMATVGSLAAMQRARELFFLGREHLARREWADATRNMGAVELLAAGKLAEHWGWYYKGIQAAIGARYWDDLQLRFPLAYAGDVSNAAASTRIEVPLLYAIARQESAFAAHARSPAGAMGLMQLMPGTARRTARRVGMPQGDLVNPSHNIQLGSHYLHQLLEEFNGNPVLAAAAYNAGPYRVKQWLESSTRHLPYDIWIETIPYRETRGYVQNVLSYSVIYAHRMGMQWPLIKLAEEGDEEQQSGGLSRVQKTKDTS